VRMFSGERTVSAMHETDRAARAEATVTDRALSRTVAASHLDIDACQFLERETDL
jgi:hypothetical protein